MWKNSIVIKYFIRRFYCSNSSSNVIHNNNNNNKKIMKYLNVAEKHDAAKTIAGLLSKGSGRRREGLSVYNKIFDFEANVRGQNCKMVMTSVSGHLLNYEFLLSYKNWQNCDPQQLFDAPIRKSCTDDGEKIKKTLEREIKSCQGLIIWTDCDREGENIGFEIIKVCTDIKPNLTVYRAKFSEITGASVRRALTNLTQPDKRQSDAVDVRQELDLRTGAAFTRFQTIRLQRIFPSHIADKLISYGSCQIPTLGFVARRYKEIEEFVSEAFWKIRVTHTIDDLTVEFTWDRNRLFDKEACEDYLMLCLAEPTATVVNVTVKPKNKWRPCPMDTVELEKLGSRKLKLAAKEIMTIAEKLYTQGIISYPRTETTIFSPDINLRSLVEQHTAHPQWGEFASKVIEWGPNPRKGNKSDQAHPPIHPIKYTTNLNGNEQRVYELIVRHFLACVSKDATGSETVVNITIAGEKFHATGLCIYERNYLDVYIYEKWNAKQIHRYENGQTFEPTEISMQEGCTTAPPLLTEADLIGLMEKHGIGTDATHAEHIHKIKERGYIGEAERGLLVPGTIGMGLYEGYDAMDLTLAYPMLRAEFEVDLKKICTGEKNPQDVLRDQIVKYKEAYRIFIEKIRALDEKVAKRLNETIQESNETTTNSVQEDSMTATITANRIEELFKCPKCKSASMALRRKKDNIGYYLGCLNFPDCRNSVWFSDEILEICLTNDLCNRCGPGYRMMKIKFKRNNYLMILNATNNTTYTTCIGCDTKFREIFNINVDNVKNVGRIVGSRGAGGNGNENNANIVNNSSSNDRNRGSNSNTRTNNERRRQQQQNGGTSTSNNGGSTEIRISRTFSTNTTYMAVGSNNNGTTSSSSSRNNRSEWNNQRENRPPVPSNHYRNTASRRNDGDGNDDFFGDDGFDDLFASPDLVEQTTSNAPQNNNFSSNNQQHWQQQWQQQQQQQLQHQQQYFADHNDDDSFSIWDNAAATATAMTTDDDDAIIIPGNSWPINVSWPNTNSLSSAAAAADIPWGRNNVREMNENSIKCSGCHQPAKELTVKKDGPNKGRSFYACPKSNGGSCKFFVWADEATNQQQQQQQNQESNRSFGNSNSNNNLNTSTTEILCNVCQRPAKSLIVKKDGPNKGRHFYACNTGCSFFKWADENESPNDGGGQGNSWGVNGGNNATTSWGGNGGGGNYSNWGEGSSGSGTSRGRNGPSTSSTSNPRKRKCGLCRQEGHTKLKCPRKEEFESIY